VPNVWVVNASPVITLAKAGHLALLTEMADKILLPEAVAAELLMASAADPARQAVMGGWGTRIAVTETPATVLEWGLGAGETAVLAVALTRGDCTAVLDDAAGRKCARTLGIPAIGTLGIILRAKHQGRIASAARVMQDLRAVGLYLDDAMITDILRHSAGETWPL
jgi:predicted nucleic acid-binding protein